MNAAQSLDATRPKLGLTARAAAALIFIAALQATAPAWADLPIGNNPLYLVSGKANVLVTLDNSNSMDEDATGAAVGSNSAASKSEIARGVVRSLTDIYRNRINMGLMSYRQNSPAANYLHNSPYDASYDPAHYDPTWTGARDSATHKRFRIANPTSPGNYIHYNVGLPFYDGSNQGTQFCYSRTADASHNFVDGNGWDFYRCFSTKVGTSNVLPADDGAAAAAAGYSGSGLAGTFWSTDSDYAQGITDFGRFITWNAVSRTWFNNGSPGRGNLNVPIANLSTAQATAIKAKLACNIPGDPAPCTASGIQNAGLTPIEGTLLTAKDYFGGGWNNAGEGYVAGCYPLPTSCGKDFVILLTDGLPSTDKLGNIVSDPTAALAAAAAAAASLKAAGIETYVIGFALPYGTDPASLNAVAEAGGTVTAYNAGDSASLEAAFKTIFDDIFRKTSAFGSISQNSTAINDGSRVYQGRFDSTDWSGELEALQPLDDGSLVSKWNTSDAGHIPAAASRKVFTLLPGTGGVAFKVLGDLSTAQQNALKTGSCGGAIADGNDCAQARIDWLRGDQSKEESAGPLRKRSRILGDIISSSPYYVSDSKTIYVGANDGMLHAFDALTGNELFTYVPNAVIPGLHRLTSAAYAHEYFVDGEIAVSVRAETPGGKNILVGSLGRGGKTLYALDVTNPAGFGAAQVLWEFTDADLGVSLGKPFIAKLNNGKTAVIVGNGYNSGSERAVLFVIDIESGALIRKLDTLAGSNSETNGMASPRGWDRDGNGTLDWLYAGDRLGNVWKFNLGAATPASWVTAYGTEAAPLPLFTARDADGKRQPITGGMSLGIDSRSSDPNYGKLFVYFGTGQYLVSTDVTDKSVQTWYGIVDSGSPVPGRSDLKQRSILAEGTVSGNIVRVFATSTDGDMASKRGWYMDFVPPSGPTKGERVTTDPKFLGSVLIVTSIVPTSDVCTPGGDGFLNAVDPFTGANPATPFFDATGDALFTIADTLTVDGKKYYVGSISPNNNLPSEAILIGNRLITSGTSGKVVTTGANNPIRAGRIAWREIVRQR